MPGTVSVSPRRAAGPIIEPRWRTETGEAALAIAPSPRGDLLAAASADGMVLLLDGIDGRVVQSWAAHAFGTLALGWSRVEQVLASGGQDGRLCFWRADAHTPVASVKASPDTASAGAAPWVEHVVWSPDGALCATAAGSHVALWHPDGTLHRRFAPFRSTVADLRWLPDGERLSAVGYGGTVVWHRDMDDPVERYAWKGSFLCHAWAPTGRWLAAGMQESAVHIFEVATKGDLEMSGYSQKVRRISWSGDGKKLITTGGAYGTVWNFAGKGPAGTHPVSLAGHVLPLTDVAFFHQGLWVATGGEDGQLLVWDLVSSSKQAMAAGFIPAPLLCLAWHPSERRVFSSHQSGWVVGWPAVR
jgi:WD40 repeat protein